MAKYNPFKYTYIYIDTVATELLPPLLNRFLKRGAFFSVFFFPPALVLGCMPSQFWKTNRRSHARSLIVRRHRMYIIASLHFISAIAGYMIMTLPALSIHAELGPVDTPLFPLFGRFWRGENKKIRRATESCEIAIII